MSAQQTAVRAIGPLSVRAETGAEALSEILAPHDAPVCVGFANTHLLYCALREPRVADVLQSFVLLNDGIGLTLIARLVAGSGFPENLNGTDFTPRVLAAAAGARVFLFGARREIVRRAAARLQAQFPGLEICGIRDGYDDARDEAALLAEIERQQPDIVLVALGNPLQELWISRLSRQMRRGVVIGVGALFDFIAEDKRRAPLFMRRLRLEWLMRLAQEPRRLWRRYTIELLYVLVTLLRTPRPPTLRA